MSTTKWLPLESNPDVMNGYLKKLGVPETLGVSDIMGMDEEFLDAIPIPSLAILLLFPTTPNYEKYWESHETLLKAMPGEVDDVYYMKQTFMNGCGAIALIHAIANNESRLGLSPDSVLKKFLDSSRGLSPEERGKYLEEDTDIGAVHESSAQEGQSETPDLDDEIHQHFITLVNVNGKLLELDGRKEGPIIYGPTSEISFLKDALGIVKEYMKRDPDNLKFTALSFGAKYT